MRLLSVLAVAAGLAAACNDDGNDEGDDGAEPFFPEDYEAAYTLVRDCRASGDHDLNNIQVWASPEAVGPYQEHMDPFPEGAVLIKAEYGFGDSACADDPIQWTTMQRLPTDSSPDTLDWSWQKVDFDRNVTQEDGALCIACHTACGGNAPPGFPYESTCTEP